MRPPRKTNRPASVFLTTLGLLFVLAPAAAHARAQTQITTGVIQGTVAGPIKKDKAFFFVAQNRPR